MAEREYNYTRGNNAFAPNREFYPGIEEKREEKRRVQKKTKVKTYKVRKIKGVIGISWLIFLLGGLTVASYGSLYNIQDQLIKTNNEIKSVEAANEALKVDLLEFYSIHKLKELATEKEMVLPTKSEAIEVKWSKNYFENMKK